MYALSSGPPKYIGGVLQALSMFMLIYIIIKHLQNNVYRSVLTNEYF